MKRILTIIMAVLMLGTALVGCGEEPADTQSTNSTQSTDGTQSGNGDTSEKNDNQIGSAPEIEKLSYDKFPDKLTATKIGSIAKDNISASKGGIYYKNNNKYGIMTLDGTKDTGAKYDYCSSNDRFFEVTTDAPAEDAGIDGMNCFGLVNVYGEVLIPEEYANITVLNDRYAQVCEVTEPTDNKDEALLYISDNIFSITASDDDEFYKGNWYVYDLTTGKKVEGVSGTQAYSVTASGNYISYRSDDAEEHVVNASGKALPAGATLYENGYYKVTEGNLGVMYNSNDEKAFTFELNGHVPKYLEDEYFIATKYESGTTTILGVEFENTTTYVLMNLKGETVSAKFKDMPAAYGELIHSGEKLYTFDGKCVIDENYKRVFYEDCFGFAWLGMIYENNIYKWLDKDGNVIFEAKDEDPFVVWYDNFTAVERTEGDDGFTKTKYYSIKQKRYSIEGTNFAPWLVNSPDANYTYKIVDTISGEAIISGYSTYTYQKLEGAGIYVYAKTASGDYDIYHVK